MPIVPDISGFSEDELNDLIAEATNRRAELQASRKREGSVGEYGTKGQDVHNPKHGVIPVPTPNDVKDVGPTHGIEDQDAGPMEERASGV